MKNKFEQLEKILKERILVLDGAMGTMIQRKGLSEEDFRGEKFRDHPVDLKGNNDLLSITQPEVIKEIHCEYFAAGADIVETNTFNGTAISQADYKTQKFVYEMNFAAAKIAKEAADEFNKNDPGKPRFVAGALGPTNRTLTLSPDVNDPGYRAVSFDQMMQAYYESTKGLADGGADILLIETIFDTLNAKAAIYAVDRVNSELKNQIPVMISGQTTEAFWISIFHAKNLLSVGLNCSLGAKQMRPFVEELSTISNKFLSVYPNAGLPNEMGEYDETPNVTSSILKDFAESGFVNLVGGCCGTTPDHIKDIAEAVKESKPRKVPAEKRLLKLSGLEDSLYQKNICTTVSQSFG